MAFIRTVKRENPFVQIDKTFFEDENLQWESKGLLGYILSRPDDWKINQTDLVNRSSGGKGKVESALLDLMANGYVHWYVIRKDNGQIDEWVYDVYERPEFNPKKDECIAEGKRRIEEKKMKNKRKNDKRRGNESPESDNPEVDNPKEVEPILDNPSYTNNDLTNIDLTNIEEEEEELITVENVESFLTEQIEKREITNLKTIKAIMEVASKCKAINTNNKEAMENYSIKVVEEKMALLGQKQAKQAQSKQATKQSQAKKPVKTELLPDWFDEDNNDSKQDKNIDPEQAELNRQDIEEMLKRLRS